MTRKRTTWTPARDFRLLDLLDDGLTDHEIGLKLGVTGRAVGCRRRRIGVRVRGERAVPISFLIRSAVVSPISRLWLRRM